MCKVVLFLIFGCTGSSLLCVGFSLVVARWGLTFIADAWVSHCGGFSCCGARALGTRASVVVARGLRLGLPGPESEPMSSALAGRFSTTAPPEKSSANICL